MQAYILLLGKASSENILKMASHCDRQGHRFAILDTQRFGKDAFLYRYKNQALVLKLAEQSITLDQISGIYWDNISMPNANAQDSVNIASMLQVLFTQSQLNWVNSWQAFQFHKTKPSQLLLAESLGATIPNTYIGNDLPSATQFINNVKTCIVKPLHGGQLTQKLTTTSKNMLSKLLGKSPMTIQAFIAGTNVRTFVVGTTLYSAQIDSEHIDFRQDGDITITPIKVPRHIELLSVRIMRAFHMQWTAIDWRVTDNGEYVFLEANPAPMFAQFERSTGYPISHAVFDLLKSNTSQKQQSPETTY